jgi:putative redox protein
MAEQPHFVEITAESVGGLHFRVTHGPSGSNFVTDAPKDNGGEGSGYSPTDLVATGLLDCMLTTMTIVAKRENIPWGRARGRVEKHMADNPRRIGMLVVDLWFPPELPDSQRERMQHVALHCPVYRSLHPDVKIDTRFHF